MSTEQSSPVGETFDILASGKWHYAPVPTWIHDIPGLTATSIELYERLLAMAQTSRNGLRAVTLDQMRFLLTKPNGKPTSKTAVKDALSVLKKNSLLEETFTGSEGKKATHRYVVHTEPNGQHLGWQNSWEKLDDYQANWEEGGVDAPTYQVQRSVTVQVAGNPASNPQVDGFPSSNDIAGRFSDQPGRFSDQETGNDAGQSGVSRTPKRYFEEGKNQEGHTSADADESVTPEVVDQVCKKLADTIKERGLKRPKVTYAWRDAARDLLTPDEDGFAYTLEEVEGGIEWAQAHSFWASRVMTMRKFAEHFPKIMSQARDELSDPKTEAGKKAQEDLVSRRLKRLDQMESDLEEKLGRPLNFSERRKMQEFVREEIR